MVLVAIGVGLLVAVVAIPWGDDAPAEKAAPVYHRGDSIDVAVGEEFMVALARDAEHRIHVDRGRQPRRHVRVDPPGRGRIAARRRGHPGDDLHRPPGG